MKDDIFRFDISVDDSQRVNFVDCLANLAHDESDSSFRERLRLLELVVKLSSRSHLQDDVDVGRVVEAAVHLDNVGVIQKLLNLHFPDELISDLLLVQEFLLDHFQGTHKIRILLLHQIHSPVFAVSQLLQLDEVVHSHLAGTRLGDLGEVPGQLHPVTIKCRLHHLAPLHIDSSAVSV